MSSTTLASKPAAPSANPDLAAIKARQQTMWASGDFAAVAARIVFTAEALAEAADLQAGERVLDVATGSGNLALAAARRGCEATGVDYVPALLDRARTRAQAELLDVKFEHGDAEKLPFADASFDAVVSIYGCMFAPDHRKTASELARVCRSGGTIALACWTPDGFIGEMFRLVARFLPPAPGVTPAVRWGEGAYLGEIFGKAARSIRTRVQTAVMRYVSAEDNVSFFRTYYGPTLKTFEAVAEKDRLASEMADLVRKYDRNGGKKGAPVAIAADYLETIITRA